VTYPRGRFAGEIWWLVGIVGLFVGPSTLAAGLEYGGLKFGEASPEDVKTVRGEFHGCEVAKTAPPNDKVDASKWAADAVTICTVILTKGPQDEPSSIWQEFVFQNGVLQVVLLRASDSSVFENLVAELMRKYSDDPEKRRPFISVPERHRIVIWGGPIRVGAGVEPPKLVQRFEPAYPAEVQKARVEGVAIVEAVISAAGNVEDPKLLKSPNRELGESALHAISRWKYRPATVDGDPVPIYLTVTTTFSLNGSGGRR
jgi:TonB family protein